MDTLNILITGVGSPTPRGFSRALKQLGNYKNYRLFGTDIHKYAIGLYQNEIFEETFLTPKSTEEGYWEATQRIIDDYDIDIAVIIPEREVQTWSERQASIGLPCKALIPDIDVLNGVVDKSLLTHALMPHGLVPKSLDINPKDSELEKKIDETLIYPFWIRSATGSSGLGSFKVKSYSDLLKWVSINEDVTNFIASDYLPGRNLACKLLYYNGKLVRSAIAERINYIMAKVAPSGITGNTSYGRLLNDKNVFDVSLQAIEIMFEKTGGRKHGFFTVDLKEDQNGKPYITEINVRPVAFNSTFASGGANLCEDSIRLLDEDKSFNQEFKLYEFEEGLIFLREVDALPIVINEKDLI